MIGYVAALKLGRDEFSTLAVDIDPNLRLVEQELESL